MLLVQQAVCIWAMPQGEELADFLENGTLYGGAGELMEYNPAVLEQVAKSGAYTLG